MPLSAGQHPRRPLHGCSIGANPELGSGSRRAGRGAVGPAVPARDLLGLGGESVDLLGGELAGLRVAAPTSSEREVRDRLWTVDPGFRGRFGRLTVVWGLAVLLEAVIRLPLGFVPPTDLVATLSPVMTPVLVTVLVIWTVRHSQRTVRALRARQESEPAGPAG